MADILEIPSELEVGVFSDNLLSTQLDTIERVNGLYNDFNIPAPQHSFIPKELNTDEILKSGQLPKSTDYVTSDDPKIREIGKNAMAQDAAGNRALTKGFGLPNMVRYQEGQEKFTNTHWFNASGKAKFGFDPYKTMAENEEFYHQNVWNEYSAFGKGWRGIGTFAGRTLSKFATGLVGMVGDIGSMAWNGLQELNEAAGGQKNNFWADVSDNWLARTMEEADQYVKNQVLPTYKALNYDDKGAFAKLTDPYFWSNDLADGAGFLLQFAVPATLFGKAAQLGKIGKLGRFGKVMAAGVGELPTASRLAKGVGSSLEFLTGSRNVGGITAHAFNTVMESVAETKEGFNQTVKDLIAKGYSEHEAKQIAAENAPGQFGANMGILSVSNAFENKWFQRLAGNRFNPIRSSIDDAGRIATKPSNLVGRFFAGKIGNPIYFYGKQGAKAAIFEGYWEENAQLAAQRVARGEYMRRGEDTAVIGKFEKAVSFWKQLIKQTYDAASGKDREAADSIMAGAVIGILGGGAFSKLSGTRQAILGPDGKTVVKPKTILPEGVRRQELRDNAELVAQVRNAQDAWLTINVMPDDLYDSNGQINEDKAKARINEINQKLDKISSVIRRRLTMDDLTDQTKRENLQYTLFGDYVKAHIMNGSGEALVNRLKNWGNKTKDELAMYGVTEEIAENPLHWATVAQNLLNEYKNVDRIKYANNTNETVNSYFQKERALKSLVFDYIAQKQAAQTTASKYAELEAENDPFKSVDVFNSYNKLIMRKLLLENSLSQLQMDEEAKEHYKAELNRVNEQIDMRKKSLPEHQTGNQSDMAFEMNTDVDQQENEIAKTLEPYFEYQFAKEDFLRAIEGFDILINQYSDPQTGIENWNKVVDYWAKANAKTRLAKLKNLGYTEAEVTNIPEEEQNKLIEENKKKEPEIPQPEVKKEEPKEPTFEEVKALTLQMLQSIDPKVTVETMDSAVDKLLAHIEKAPDSITQESKDILTKYVQMRTAQVKTQASQQAADQSKQQTENAPTSVEGNPVVVMPDTPLQDVKVEPTLTIQDEKVADIERRREEEHKKWNYDRTKPNPVDIRFDAELAALGQESSKVAANEAVIPPPPPPPPILTGDSEVPKSLLDEVREAYRLQEKAFENETTFKEEAEKEGMKIHNNRIDNHVDGGKNDGDINIVTSNPKELQDGKIKVEDNNLARFNFLDNLMNNRLSKDDYKMVLSIGKNGGIFGIISDLSGTPVNFGNDGMPFNEGLPILFYLDYDMYYPKNIGKRRMEVVPPPFPVAPLTATPIELHPSFVDRDVIEMLKDRIRRTTVTASLEFLTQGLLYREGTTNGYSVIPKTSPTHSATELWSKKHLREEKGSIPLEDMVINGVYRRAHRIQFSLLREIGNPEAGVEVAEFHPLSIGEVKNEKGEKIFDLLKTPDGKNLFQAAIEGNLEATKENLTTLTSLLRPDKFIVLNLGTSILVINLKRFKKFVNSDNITVDELRKLTTLEDIANSELNFTKAFYDNEDEVEMLDGILGTGRNNYSRFINNNVLSSAMPIKKGDKEGYARINKRIALTLDEDIDDMIKAQNQREQENKAPEVTEVTEGDELTEQEKKSIMKTPVKEEEDFGDDFTKKEC